MRVFVFSLTLCFAGFTPAEDKKPEPKGEAVDGKVAFNGQSLPGGTVTFVSKDGKTTVTGKIDENGSYKATVPVGEYGVAVDTTAPKPADPKELPKEQPKKLPLIPEKYRNAKTSGLTYTVVKGKQTFDIELR